MCKGIFGIRDLTKIRRTIRENVRYLSGSTGLKSYLEAVLFRILVKDAGFFGLYVVDSVNLTRTHLRMSARKIYRISHIQESKLLLDYFYVIVFENKREIAG